MFEKKNRKGKDQILSKVQSRQIHKGVDIFIAYVSVEELLKDNIALLLNSITVGNPQEFSTTLNSSQLT